MKMLRPIFRVFLILGMVIPTMSSAGTVDIGLIDKITGMKGEFNDKENVYKLSLPRKDLHIMAAGVQITPFMGLTAWAAFTKPADHVMVMGDIVLTEGQVNAVMSAALDAGLEVTALHNHFFGDTPKIMFMHIGGMGDEEKLATAVKSVFDTLKSTASAQFPQATITTPSNLDPKKIDAVLSRTGTLKDGVYKLTFGRTTQMDGHDMGNAMGVNTWAAFVGSDDNALVVGDYAMLESELQGVLKALRKAGIFIVAIHNHMAMENPRMVFLHYWGTGSTSDLAKALKSALDTQHSR